ncbi:MAG TPA: laccase domain-containing protein, partial [Streptosporangiaceae bacterium]
GAHPADIVAGVGPAAFPYQVGAGVADAATAAFGADAAGLLEPVSPGQWNFGLWAANRIVLRHAGVPDVNIHVTDVPTGPSPASGPNPTAPASPSRPTGPSRPTFFSHRAEQPSGRFAAIARLQQKES